MRNQGWLQDGTLIKDDEFYLDNEVLKVREITGNVREPTDEETEQFYYKKTETTDEKINKLDSRIKELEKK